MQHRLAWAVLVFVPVALAACVDQQPPATSQAGPRRADVPGPLARESDSGPLRFVLINMREQAAEEDEEPQ